MSLEVAFCIWQHVRNSLHQRHPFFIAEYDNFVKFYTEVANEKRTQPHVTLLNRILKSLAFIEVLPSLIAESKNYSYERSHHTQKVKTLIDSDFEKLVTLIYEITSF